jgi:hypothetical protein
LSEHFCPKRVICLRVGGRPSYNDWLTCSRRLSVGISLFANADIFFDESVRLLGSYLKRPKSVVALSRHDFADGSFRVSSHHRNPLGTEFEKAPFLAGSSRLRLGAGLLPDRILRNPCIRHSRIGNPQVEPMDQAHSCHQRNCCMVRTEDRNRCPQMNTRPFRRNTFHLPHMCSYIDRFLRRKFRNCQHCMAGILVWL